MVILKMVCILAICAETLFGVKPSTRVVKGVKIQIMVNRVVPMINDKMLDNGQISEKLHSSIQKDIITLSTFNTAAAKNGEQMDSSDEYCQRIS